MRFHFGALVPKSTGVVSSFFQTKLSDKWSIGDAPNGGYLMSLAIEAMRMSTGDHTDMLSCSGYYLNKALENKDCDIEVRVLNQSRSSTYVESTIVQENIPRVKFIASIGNIDKLKGINHNSEKGIVLPPLEECIDANKFIRKVYGSKLRIANEFELFLPPTCEFAKSTLKGTSSSVASLEGYVKLNNATSTSMSYFPFYLDCCPPPILNVTKVDWVPTVAFTVNTFANLNGNNSDWFRVRFVSPYVHNGLLYEDGELWSHCGKVLLAKSRQCARLLSSK